MEEGYFYYVNAKFQLKSGGNFLLKVQGFMEETDKREVYHVILSDEFLEEQFRELFPDKEYSNIYVVYSKVY